MKYGKYILIVVLLLATLLFAQPSFADAPKFTKNPDYIALTKEIKKLQTAKETQTPLEGYMPEQIENKLSELEFQKYAFQSGINWGQCRNETGKTLAIYGPEANLDEEDDDEEDDDEEDDEYSAGAALYFLADGETTKNRWDCKGIYLPSDVKANALTPDGQTQELSGGVAIKVNYGTKLVLKTNPETGVIEFNQAGTRITKPGEVNWYIPNVSQAVVDARVTNAPINKG